MASTLWNHRKYRFENCPEGKIVWLPCIVIRANIDTKYITLSPNITHLWHKSEFYLSKHSFQKFSNTSLNNKIFRILHQIFTIEYKTYSPFSYSLTIGTQQQLSGFNTKNLEPQNWKIFLIQSIVTSQNPFNFLNNRNNPLIPINISEF